MGGHRRASLLKQSLKKMTVGDTIQTKGLTYSPRAGVTLTHGLQLESIAGLNLLIPLVKKIRLAHRAVKSATPLTYFKYVPYKNTEGVY